GGRRAGFVGGTAQHRQGVGVRPVEPVAAILRRHPGPPADLEPLIEIELVDPQHDVSAGQHTEDGQLPDEGVPVAVLQRVVKARIPLIDQHRDAHHREFDCEHGGEQRTAGEAVFGAKVRDGEPPDGGERRSQAGQGILRVTCLRRRKRAVPATAATRRGNETAQRDNAANRALWIGADLSKLSHCRWNTNWGRAVHYTERFPEAADRTREDSHMSTEKLTSKVATRRRFVLAAGVSAAAVAAPNVVSAQGPISMRWQSTWPSKDIFHEYALDYAKKVNDMTGGDLKIEVLPAGAGVPAFGLLDAVSKGTLDGGHGVLVYHYGKQTALALWGSGPGYAMDANMLLAWHKYGGGKELLAKLYASLGLNVVSFPYGPMYTQPLGWDKKPITKPENFQGLKFRTVGLSIDVFQAMGAAVNALPGGEIVSAMDRGLIEAAEFNNASSDRILGFADVSKICMLQSYHQNAEQLEITFNKTKFDSLPDKMKAIIANGVEAASQDMQWKSIDRYSKDYIELQTKDNVKFYKTPDSVLKKQLEVYDVVAAKKSAENPLFKEIVESQVAFARRATQWEQDTVVSRKMVFDHYFGPQGVAKKT